MSLMKKELFFFFCLVLVVLVLGCTDDNGDTTENDTQVYTPSVFAGNLSVRGQGDVSRLVLNPGQQEEIFFNFENSGEQKAENVIATIYGCNIDVYPNITYPALGEEPLHISSGKDREIKWQIVAPRVPEGGTFDCTLAVRVCFDYFSEGESTIELVPRYYGGETSIMETKTTQGPFNIEIKSLSPVTFWNETVPIDIEITYKNIGGGEVAYIDNPSKNKHIDHIELIIDDSIFKIDNIREWNKISFPRDTHVTDMFPGKTVSLSGDYIVVDDGINIPSKFETEINEKNDWIFSLDYDSLQESTDQTTYTPPPFFMRLIYSPQTRRYDTLSRKVKLFAVDPGITSKKSKEITTVINYSYCVTTDTIALHVE